MMPAPQTIPLVDLDQQHAPLRDEIDQAISACIEKNQFIGGSAVKQFAE